MSVMRPLIVRSVLKLHCGGGRVSGPRQRSWRLSLQFPKAGVARWAPASCGTVRIWLQLVHRGFHSLFVPFAAEHFLSLFLLT